MCRRRLPRPGPAAIALVSLITLTAACGGGDDDDDTIDPDAAATIDGAPLPDTAPAGPGLEVVGSFVVNNAINSEAPDTTTARRTVNASVRITRAGAPVNNAIVRVNPPQAFETFLTGEALEPNHYTGNYAGYFNNTVRVEIGADDDSIPQTVLIGQQVFRITAPNAAETVTAGADLLVEWSRPGAAADVLVVTTDGGHDSGQIADAASYTIAGADITTAVPDDAIHVLRCHTNDALPGAAADGSAIDFCVDSRLAFSVVAP